MLTSCWSLPGYRSPAPLEPELYDKFTQTAREENADIIISTGDIVYLQPMSIMSKTAIQEAYTQLRQYSRLEGTWANHTWITCNDDHEFSYNDGNINAPIIKTLRNTYSENFPLLSDVSSEYRANIRNIKNINFITLDSVSSRTLNPKPVGNNKYLSILGKSQLQFLLDALSNILVSYGTNALCFVIVGKSMFGSQSDMTFLFCPHEREQIFNYIKSIGLRNVCFLCGDSHFSDVSEHVLNKDTNQILREIRCSAIGSKPRVGDINSNRVEGSLVNKNNFGKINVNGTYNDYTISYSDYTIVGVIYTYEWNINYV
jgi:phosphodiesterase/alkaline phosphatase D-like protein